MACCLGFRVGFSVFLFAGRENDNKEEKEEEMLDVMVLTGNPHWRLPTLRPTSTRWSNRQHDEKCLTREAHVYAQEQILFFVQ